MLQLSGQILESIGSSYLKLSKGCLRITRLLPPMHPIINLCFVKSNSVLRNSSSYEFCLIPRSQLANNSRATSHSESPNSNCQIPGIICIIEKAEVGELQSVGFIQLLAFQGNNLCNSFESICHRVQFVAIPIDFFFSQFSQLAPFRIRIIGPT